MNSDKYDARQNSGNAILYVLLALALLGALTMVLARQNDQASGENLSSEQVELLTARTVSYAGSVKNAVDQMLMSGTQVGNLDYLRPAQAGYDTAPYINRVFHPEGGGVTYQSATAEVFEGLTDTPPAGWYLSRPNNVEWTPTTASDVILVAYRINRPLCEAINQKITGSRTIPALTVSLVAALLSAGDVSGGGGSPLTKTTCAACEGHPALCVSDSSAVNYAYYNIISGQ